MIHLEIVFMHTLKNLDKSAKNHVVGDKTSKASKTDFVHENKRN